MISDKTVTLFDTDWLTINPYIWPIPIHNIEYHMVDILQGYIEFNFTHDEIHGFGNVEQKKKKKKKSYLSANTYCDSKRYLSKYHSITCYWCWMSSPRRPLSMCLSLPAFTLSLYFPNGLGKKALLLLFFYYSLLAKISLFKMILHFMYSRIIYYKTRTSAIH